MVKVKSLVSIIVIFVLTGCWQQQRLYLYSNDKSQCITVIDDDGFRFIIEGKHSEIPESNFVMLDLKNVDSLGDAIHVCWKGDIYEWEVVIDKSIVMESKLDTARFNFKTFLPQDERDVPTELKFRT